MKLLRPMGHPPQMTKIESSDGNYLLFDLAGNLGQRRLMLNSKDNW